MSKVLLAVRLQESKQDHYPIAFGEGTTRNGHHLKTNKFLFV